jgi:hypothetical protein
VVGRRGDGPAPVRVVDDEVRIRTHGDRALPRVQPEQPGRRGGDDLDPPLAADAPADDATIVEQVHPVLDARQAVGDLAKVAPSELLLAVEVERAVVRGDKLEVVLDETAPQVVPVVLWPQRWRADELGAFEPVAEIVERQEQVLRARLGNDA